MVDLGRRAEGQAEGEVRVHQRVQQAKDVRTSHQQDAQPVRHDRWVKQRVADGRVAVVCHRSQKEALRGPKSYEKKKLGGTAG